MSPPRKKEKKVEEEAAKPPPAVLHSGVIRIEMAKKDKNQTSKAVNIGDVEWRAGVNKERVIKRLGGGGAKGEFDAIASLCCFNYSPSPLWSIVTNVRFELINVDSSKNIVKETTQTFDNKSNNWKSCRHILFHWKDLMDEKEGFIVDDIVTFVINVDITNMWGFRKFVPPQFDFTDPNEPLHDATLVIDGEKIYVSKGILSAYSPFFNAMFFGGFNEKDKNEIEIKDVDREEFIEMLRVIYPSHQKITDDNVEYLLNLADRFEIIFILDLAEKHLMSSSELELQVKLLLSDRYRLIKLQSDMVGDWIRYREEAWIKCKESPEYNELSDELKEAVKKKCREE